ncbi:MAG: prepilin-type N-terminal cleavage/methylation domain-containing protein [Desulfobacula sp.]|jgi:prepilin-type N-terminal cleavage/methylation domain-containing protein|uniref:prepilin-type N-terminal cleavage/methylation domain-containing protein n=1 Tax=Desulfobacula sp. TaxID=2593537 RepID=UPI001D70307B|nr:prepilin-type N-terminal cleavage/methylation domain-containing protein [Desulfobacula sp.]MBT3486893.1 prepilin-type N-terminal cleavage/methylation domain-containing protein [Desulfobacula sp.]MBT3805631.1 prepilin-type N-terminal cleavage/methylation domain-containing protein [Desulfobacula sp.]MBT4026503.1 prepilin-type N-terminal cleavage/methylation domain-containing protein [Desulfobacula sp.]MBT4199606.1 prepilin-type N-terminal cleavage/methylation domain-containing protein [Desulfo
MKNFILKLKQTSKVQKGFTLIEILIAIAILSIGLLSIAAMQVSAIRGNAKSNKLSQRTTTASNHIEYLLNLPFNDSNLSAGNHDPENDGVDNDGDGVTDEPDDDGELKYSVTWNITDDTSSQKTIALTIAVTSYGSATTLTINTIRIR